MQRGCNDLDEDHIGSQSCQGSLDLMRSICLPHPKRTVNLRVRRRHNQTNIRIFGCVVLGMSRLQYVEARRTLDCSVALISSRTTHLFPMPSFLLHATQTRRVGRCIVFVSIPLDVHPHAVSGYLACHMQLCGRSGTVRRSVARLGFSSNSY
ncbi:hypothetical protein L227DRAFT_135567 [Lentinus tigrinus ALCF2SS1-6]|uniref:Uncharacterized protein n=1 Tax=Lentinus tigrinus ALCF2SS1-6 TaxID=1328759 RepID=A0A5C2T0E1_9APHY|nr:hypothetical protein L227DRAFT_135567 [Lentinus tigrinus ALCF2SS1-6]